MSYLSYSSDLFSSRYVIVGFVFIGLWILCIGYLYLSASTLTVWSCDCPASNPQCPPCQQDHTILISWALRTAFSLSIVLFRYGYFAWTLTAFCTHCDLLSSFGVRTVCHLTKPHIITIIASTLSVPHSVAYTLLIIIRFVIPILLLFVLFPSRSISPHFLLVLIPCSHRIDFDHRFTFFLFVIPLRVVDMPSSMLLPSLFCALEQLYSSRRYSLSWTGICSRTD